MAHRAIESTNRRVVRREGYLATVGLVAMVSAVATFATPLTGGQDKGQHATASQYTVSRADYEPPNVVLVDRYGKSVQLADVLDQPRPVLLQLIFTSCTTICPVLSATFEQAQNDVASLTKDYEMVSISIDPEYDTPERLDAYARRCHAGSNWIFLTGKKAEIRRILRAFDALYQNDNKMYHRPYTFLRSRSRTSWVRLEGYLSVSDLLHEYRSVLDESKVQEKTAVPAGTLAFWLSGTSEAFNDRVAHRTSRP